MKNIYQTSGLAMIIFSFSVFVGTAHHEDALLEAVNNSDRNVAYSARDNFRNPYETLSFFQIKPTMNVLELAAGGGWYTEILAPYLKADGQLFVTHYNPEAGEYYKRSRNSYEKKVASNPLFEGIKVITMETPPAQPFTKPESQDLVVTFRNLHNWLARDAMKAVMQEAYNSLKEGGYFGVVEHRAPEGSSLEFMKKKKSGAIINITSINAKVGFPRNPSYVASKGGLKMLGKALAKDWGSSGIRVNNLGPGYIRTDMTMKRYLNKKTRKQNETAINDFFPLNLILLIGYNEIKNRLLSE